MAVEAFKSPAGFGHPHVTGIARIWSEKKERSQISFIRNCLQYLKGRIQNLGWSGEGRGCLCECLLQEIQVERRVTTTGEEFETRSCFRDPKLTVSMDE